MELQPLFFPTRHLGCIDGDGEIFAELMFSNVTERAKKVN